MRVLVVGRVDGVVPRRFGKGIHAAEWRGHFIIAIQAVVRVRGGRDRGIKGSLNGQNEKVERRNLSLGSRKSRRISESGPLAVNNFRFVCVCVEKATFRRLTTNNNLMRCASPVFPCGRGCKLRRRARRVSSGRIGGDCWAIFNFINSILRKNCYKLADIIILNLFSIKFHTNNYRVPVSGSVIRGYTFLFYFRQTAI